MDDTNVPLSANEIYSLETADVLTASDRQIVDDTFDSDLNEDLLSQAFKKARAMAPERYVGPTHTRREDAALGLHRKELSISKP